MDTETRARAAWQQLLSVWRKEEEQQEYPELGLQREKTPRFARSWTRFPDPRLNEVYQVQVTPDDVDGLIQEQVDFFRRLGHHFTIEVVPGTEPPDLGAHLERHGFTRIRHGLGLARFDLETPVPARPGLAVERIQSWDQFEELVAVNRACFERPPDAQQTWYRVARERFAARAERRVEMYGVRVDGRLVGFGNSRYFGDDIVYLDGAATLPEYRGRGIYATLLAHRLEAARERGCRIALIVAGPHSAPICLRYGFQVTCEFALYGSPGSPPVEFER